MSLCLQCHHLCETTHRFCPECGMRMGDTVRVTDDPLLNKTLPGGYLVLEMVATGGMGRIYRAEQTVLGRTVAIKLVHPHLLGDERATARFLAEARTTSQLNHPNAISVIDFGKTDDGQPYLVTEFLHGRSLSRVLLEETLSTERVISILRQLLSALADAHARGIIHRDLKPENIVVESLRSGEDFVKVVDFGLAKLLGRSDSPALTSAGLVCGTPEYMSPEQTRGNDIDARSDLYAVGVLLFLMLTGRLPYEDPSPARLLMAHQNRAIPDPRDHCRPRFVPEMLSAITMRAMAKNSDDRFQTAELFSQALQGALSHCLPPATWAGTNDPAAFTRCHACASPVPLFHQFCGYCGEGVFNAQPPSSTRTGRQPQKNDSGRKGAWVFPFVAREEQLNQILKSITETTPITTVMIRGAIGIGKTRLLVESAGGFAASGHGVFIVSPDSYRVGVPYFALQELIVQLAALPRAEKHISDLISGASPNAHIALRMLLGLSPKTPGLNIPNAIEALAWGIQQGQARAGKGKVVILIDDLDAIDLASQRVFAEFAASPSVPGTLFVAAHQKPLYQDWKGTNLQIELEGIPLLAAKELISATTNLSILANLNSFYVPPLWLDQVVRFIGEGGSSPPPRLADLIGLRISRFNSAERLALQAIAVFGTQALTAHVRELTQLGDGLTAAVAALVSGGFVGVSEASLRIRHPLMREVARSSIPSAASQELHRHAWEISQRERLPSEVQLRLAVEAGEAFDALMQLEQKGDLCLAQDDLDGALDTFSGGLEAARCIPLGSEVLDSSQAVTVFARKLGEVFLALNRVVQAQSSFHEALRHTSEDNQERARVLYGLSKVARRLGKAPEAESLLNQAVQMAEAAGVSLTIPSLAPFARV